jgi:hypothetical protein
MNHSYQVIRSKHLFAIHEYTYGVVNKQYVQKVEDLMHHLRKIPHHFVALVVINTTDREVCNQSAQPLVKPKDILR